MLEVIHVSNMRGLEDATFAIEPKTAIVGPNGSGKSTVLDAITFALTGNVEGMQRKPGAVADAMTPTATTMSAALTFSRPDGTPLKVKRSLTCGNGKVSSKLTVDGRASKMSAEDICRMVWPDAGFANVSDWWGLSGPRRLVALADALGIDLSPRERADAANLKHRHRVGEVARVRETLASLAEAGGDATAVDPDALQREMDETRAAIEQVQRDKQQEQRIAAMVLRYQEAVDAVEGLAVEADAATERLRSATEAEAAAKARADQNAEWKAGPALHAALNAYAETAEPGEQFAAIMVRVDKAARFTGEAAQRARDAVWQARRDEAAAKDALAHAERIVADGLPDDFEPVDPALEAALVGRLEELVRSQAAHAAQRDLRAKRERVHAQLIDLETEAEAARAEADEARKAWGASLNALRDALASVPGCKLSWCHDTGRLMVESGSYPALPVDACKGSLRARVDAALGAILSRGGLVLLELGECNDENLSEILRCTPTAQIVGTRWTSHDGMDALKAELAEDVAVVYLEGPRP